MNYIYNIERYLGHTTKVFLGSPKGRMSKNMSNYDLQKLFYSSRILKEEEKDFRSQLNGLSNFENHVTSVKATFEEAKPVYDDEYQLKIRDLPALAMSDKCVSDIIGKTGHEQETHKRVFDGIKDWNNIEGTRKLGFDYLTQVLDKSKRDVAGFSEVQHQFKLYDEKYRANVNHDFPDVFKTSTFLNSFEEVNEMKGGDEFKATLNFSEETGKLSANILTDTMTIDGASVNDEVGFGLSINDNVYGGNLFTMKPVALQLACTNGLVNTNSLALLKIKHTSVGNFAKNFGSFLSTHTPVSELPEHLRSEFHSMTRWMKGSAQRPARWVDEESEDLFYTILSVTVHDIIEKEKVEQKNSMELATADTFADFKKIMGKIYAKERWLSALDIENLGVIFNGDDTIDAKSKSRYSLASAFGRYANDFTISADKREDLQQLSQRLMTTPLINY